MLALLSDTSVNESFGFVLTSTSFIQCSISTIDLTSNRTVTSLEQERKNNVRKLTKYLENTVINSIIIVSYYICVVFANMILG